MNRHEKYLPFDHSIRNVATRGRGGEWVELMLERAKVLRYGSVYSSGESL